MRKKAFVNAYDLLMILFFAAAACILIFFVSPRGETRTVTFTVAVTEGDALSGCIFLRTSFCVTAANTSCHAGKRSSRGFFTG